MWISLGRTFPLLVFCMYPKSHESLPCSLWSPQLFLGGPWSRRFLPPPKHVLFLFFFAIGLRAAVPRRLFVGLRMFTLLRFPRERNADCVFYLKRNRCWLGRWCHEFNHVPWAQQLAYNAVIKNGCGGGGYIHIQWSIVVSCPGRA